MESAVIAELDARRAAQVAVEHVVQECCVPSGDVFVQSAVSVDFHGGDLKRVADALNGGTAVRTN
jgi:hypothetical protein